MLKFVLLKHIIGPLPLQKLLTGPDTHRQEGESGQRERKSGKIRLSKHSPEGKMAGKNLIDIIKFASRPWSISVATHREVRCVHFPPASKENQKLEAMCKNDGIQTKFDQI